MHPRITSDDGMCKLKEQTSRSNASRWNTVFDASRRAVIRISRVIRIKPSAPTGRHVITKGEALESNRNVSRQALKGRNILRRLILCAEIDFISPFQGLKKWFRRSIFPGRCPSLLHFAPLGLGAGFKAQHFSKEPTPLSRGGASRIIKTFFKILLGVTILAGCQSAPEDLAQTDALIFVKSTSNRYLNTNFISNQSTSNLFMLSPISPNGTLKNLTNLSGEGAAVADPDISFDGLRVIFSMRQNRNDKWHLFEMNVDGGNLRQLTFGDSDDCDPTFLPDGRIMFSSNRTFYRDEYERRPVEVLHIMNADGGNIERISFNMSDDFDPIVLRDGRIAWTRWEHHGTQNRFPLFFTHPDGSSTFLHFGSHRRNFWHARELEDGRLVAIMSNRVQVDRGALVILDAEKQSGDQGGGVTNLTEHISISGDTTSFKYPFPLPDGRLVVSYAPEGHEAGDYGLYLINRDGSGLSLLYNDPATNELDAVVVTPRPRPPVIPDVLNKSASTGVVINQNVYNRQRNDGQQIPEPNEVKAVMVIEAIPQQSRNRNSLTSFESKRVIGTAPILADGSFAIEIPANTPIAFNLLDSLGRAIVIKRSWLYARPGERFENCTGCHGERESPSTNPNPLAMTAQPSNLNVPEAEREVIAFANAIAPIIEAKCLPCHAGSAAPGNLNLSLAAPEGEYPIAYQNLMDRGREPRLVEVSRVPFSRRSHLVDYLLGIDDRAGFEPHLIGENALTADEIRKIITWIDLGGQYQ